jgi:hypothetical protein
MRDLLNYHFLFVEDPQEVGSEHSFPGARPRSERCWLYQLPVWFVFLYPSSYLTVAGIMPSMISQRKPLKMDSIFSESLIPSIISVSVKLLWSDNTHSYVVAENVIIILFSTILIIDLLVINR